MAAANLRTFLVAFALIFATLAGAPLAFVFVVDPGERFVADPHHFTVNRERWAKAALVRTYPHNALLMGTSKLAHVNPADVDTDELQFFNASIFGGTPEEMFSFVDKFAKNDKLVILSYDLLAMNEAVWPWQPHDWTDGGWFRLANWDYLTAPNIRDLALDYAWNGRPASTMINQNGSRDVRNEIARSDAMPAASFAHALEQIRGAGYADFKYSKFRVQWLEKTAALLRQRGTPFIVLISPEDRQVLDLIRSSGKQWALDRFRADIHRIFPGAIDYSDSWVSDDCNFFRFDPMHYFPDVGAKMVHEAIHKSSH